MGTKWWRPQWRQSSSTEVCWAFTARWQGKKQCGRTSGSPFLRQAWCWLWLTILCILAVGGFTGEGHGAHYGGVPEGWQDRRTTWCASTRLQGHERGLRDEAAATTAEPSPQGEGENSKERSCPQHQGGSAEEFLGASSSPRQERKRSPCSRNLRAEAGARRTQVGVGTASGWQVAYQGGRRAVPGCDADFRFRGRSWSQGETAAGGAFFGQTASRHSQRSGVAAVAEKLEEPSAMEDLQVPPHLRAILGEFHSSTWFRLKNDSSIVATARGTRPGDSLADILWTVSFSKFLHLSEERISSLGLHRPLRWNNEVGLCTALGEHTASKACLTWADDLACIGAIALALFWSLKSK